VPHYSLWEPCRFAKAPDGPQTYILNILWLQKDGALIGIPERSQGFTLTKNMGRVLITNQNSIQEEIKGRLKSGNACYYSVQNLLSSRLLSKKLKIKIYRNIILPVVLYGCETWSLTLKEEGRLRVFENRVLRKVFGPRRDEITGKWRKLHNEELNGL
jgi:hypothetical protein